MNWGRLAALAQMALCILASLGYLASKDYRRAIYWMAAAVITGSVTL